MDGGRSAGVPTEMAETMKAPERENRELCQANDTLVLSLSNPIWV